MLTYVYQLVFCVFGACALCLLGYYILLALAKNDILWTIVEQGWCKIVMGMGEYKETIGPGLQWIGLPGINYLYKRKMMFFKSVTDKDGNPKAEPQEDQDVSSFKTTRYPYALPFKDEEDSHGLHLSGILAAFAVMENCQKAFFKTSDWYAEMNTRILARYRKVIAQVSYDDDIVGRDTEEKQAKKTISERLWEELNHSENGSLSIIEKLLEECGIRVESVELRSIDPPDDWRATTLAPYKAMREKDAAKHKAEASAILFDDTNQALKTWLEGQRATGHNPTQAQIEAKQEELRQRALAKTSGYQQVHIKGLENASTAVVGGGGGVGILLGGVSSASKSGIKKKKTDPRDITDESSLSDALSDD